MFQEAPGRDFTKAAFADNVSNPKGNPKGPVKRTVVQCSPTERSADPFQPSSETVEVPQSNSPTPS